MRRSTGPSRGWTVCMGTLNGTWHPHLTEPPTPTRHPKSSVVASTRRPNSGVELNTRRPSSGVAVNGRQPSGGARKDPITTRSDCGSARRPNSGAFATGRKQRSAGAENGPRSTGPSRSAPSYASGANRPHAEHGPGSVRRCPTGPATRSKERPRSYLRATSISPSAPPPSSNSITKVAVSSPGTSVPVMISD